MLSKLRSWLMLYMPFFLGTPVFLWQFFFFLLPLVFIIVLSLVSVKNGQYSFGFSHFIPFFTSVYTKIIVRSLLFALSNALICLIVAYPIAYFLAFKAGRLKNIFLFLVIVPFWTNFLLHIYAWYFVLEKQGFISTLLVSLGILHHPVSILNTMSAVMVMMVYYYIPFMALPLYAVLERFDQKLLEASLDLGATWLQTFYRIMLPLSMPGILSGFFLVFVPSFAEFAIPELLGGDKKMFVGTVISYDVLGGTTLAQGAAFTLFSALILMGLALFLLWCIKKLVKMG